MQAAERLTMGDERAAQRALDRAGLGPLSPEGSMLMQAVGRRLGLTPPNLPVRDRLPLWEPRDIARFAPQFDGFARTASWLEKVARVPWDEAKHPRWPKHAPDSQGGQFRDASDTDPPGMGHNGGPPLDDPPEIPEKRPIEARLERRALRAVARWLAQAYAAEKAAEGEAAREIAMSITRVSAIIHGYIWILQHLPNIISYTDPPKTLDELKRAANSPKPGYEVHHIVEEQAGSKDPNSNTKKFPEQIDSADNRVLVPKWKHDEISTWYSTSEADLGGKTPRQYIRENKLGWDEQYRIGLAQLRRAGVLQ